MPARTVTGLGRGTVAKSLAIIAARMPRGLAATTTARTMVGTDGKDHKAAYSNDS